MVAFVDYRIENNYRFVGHRKLLRTALVPGDTVTCPPTSVTVEGW